MTAEEGCGRRGQDNQVSSNGNRGDRRGARQGEREAEIEGWSDKASDEETEEDGMPMGEQEGSKDTLTALPWGRQESGARGLQVDERAGGSNRRKPAPQPLTRR